MEATALSDLPLSADPATVLAHSPASSSCLPTWVRPIPGNAERSNVTHVSSKIVVAHSGHGRRWYSVSGRTRTLATNPRMIEMYEAGLCFEHCQWDGEPGRCIQIDLSPSDVDVITDGRVRSLALPTRHEVFDETISRIAFELAEEALNKMRNGRLYAQGLSLSLLGYLDANYGEHALGGDRLAGRFEPAQQRRLENVIREQLAADLSIARLADEVGLSVYHFSRVFKASFGVTPHRYVQNRRLEAAAAVLRRDRQRTIADIAADHGFASQSHMTSLMRIRLGTTPRELQGGVVEQV